MLTFNCEAHHVSHLLPGADDIAEAADQLTWVLAAHRDVVITADEPAKDLRGGVCSVLAVAAQAPFVCCCDLGLDVRSAGRNDRLAVGDRSCGCSPSVQAQARAERDVAASTVLAKRRAWRSRRQAGSELSHLPRLQLSRSRSLRLGRPASVAARSAPPNLGTLTTHQGSAPTSSLWGESQLLAGRAAGVRRWPGGCRRAVLLGIWCLVACWRGGAGIR